MKKNVARIFSGELEGVGARIVEIEADVNVGLHAFNIVGLADRSLNEAKERVNSALKNCGVKPPNRENRKITINLAPADMKKTGSHYDLGIAIGYLLATKQIAEFSARDTIFLGELALDGRLRPVIGALNIAERAMKEGFLKIIVPRENANEVAAMKGIAVIATDTIAEVIAILEGREATVPTPYHETTVTRTDDIANFSEIRGQENAKRALVIAAAGRHNALLIGPPGVGKSILAKAMTGILPALTHEEGIEVTKVWSAAGLGGGELLREPPFRAPHQTISPIALIGGGSDPKPGEISLAHRGVLFLDELPEFQRASLEALREPLESGELHIARAKRGVVFPARFTLIAAMNPCPCGYYGDPVHECKCTAYEIIKYQKKISGPLLDRIDLQVKVGRVELGAWGDNAGKGEAVFESKQLHEKIRLAKEVQRRRFVKKMRRDGAVRTNADMTSREAREFAQLNTEAKSFLEAIEKTHLSPRAYYRMIKAARTIADLEGNESISAEHIAEAFSYRLKEM